MDDDIIGAIAIALILWLVLMFVGLLFFGPVGVFLGHLAGVLCALAGVPQRWVIKSFRKNP